MNQKVVKKINFLTREIAELNAELKNTQLNKAAYEEDDKLEEYTQEVEDLQHLITTLTDQKEKLGKEMKNDNWTDEEEEADESTEE